MKLRARVLVLRTEFVLRRANRRRRQRLAADLATYTSQADLNDLYAVLAAYPDEQTHEVRRILRQLQVRRMWTAGGAG